ncbi:outer membrane protein assembly factor BamE [Phaeovulum vinaykumarii]|uniref:Beta-barrel assembly machine subunit BamE n=1 Tax=Phaeovulum vinaykumarii TaxID=407234 RepID=A0A1N7JPU4_9RHOB|nr:outer membrane protein assembly factor BamE [Phaeovulum vinaykumarii]SIS51372.1 Beta-barrel assembly machine subunit BamE [Phaeovulum vinaykumarii]SOB90712.1 Beta-barrel assembly machine subunit BamE [Phaeovulum vinaykumarii]
MALALIAQAGCTPVYQNHGYVPSDEDLALLEVGRDTRQDVAFLVGRPSSAGLLEGSGWYYVGSRWEHKGARAPVEIDRQVVAISFDDDGTIENIERFGLQDGQVVALSRRVTDSNIKGIGLLRQIFGSLGRISADQLFSD